MFPIIEYSSSELAAILNHSEEILKSEFTNANSKLFIYNKEIVLKFYLLETDYQKNLDNLLRLGNVPELERIPELVLPSALICIDHSIIGYSMSYIKGNNLFSYLVDPSIPGDTKLQVFTQLASVIQRLPDGIHIGDLHGNNIIVDSHDKIHLIDMDGFSIDWGDQLSVPLPLPNITGKYFDAEGQPIVSKNSDIYCVFRLFLHFVMQGYDIIDTENRDEYIAFLKDMKNTALLTRELELLYTDDENRLDENTFSHISADAISLIPFLENRNLMRKNQHAASVLENYLKGDI